MALTILQRKLSKVLQLSAICPILPPTTIIHVAKYTFCLYAINIVGRTITERSAELQRHSSKLLTRNLKVTELAAQLGVRFTLCGCFFRITWCFFLPNPFVNLPQIVYLNCLKKRRLPNFRSHYCCNIVDFLSFWFRRLFY